MSNYNHLFGFVDYTDFSVFKSFFWGDNKKEEKPKEKKINNNKNEGKRGMNRKLTYTNTVYSFNKKQKKLILKLEKVIDDYLYRKKVRNLIQKTKENYMIICSANIENLFLNINRTKKIKQYKFSYEPILKLNLAFIPRKVYRNRKKLKFTISNIKKEIFIEPLYQTEYENNSFVNVLDLQEIKDKEYKNEEDFQKFLKMYFKKDKNNKIQNNKNEEKNEQKKGEKINSIKEEEENNKFDLVIKEIDNPNENCNNIKVNLNRPKLNKSVKHRKLKSDFKINNEIKMNNNKAFKSLLKNKDMSPFNINPILKERSSQKIKHGRQISFGKVEYSY